MITSYNRHRHPCYFTPQGDDFIVSFPDAMYMRSGWGSSKDKIMFIDPEGGPFISVGSYLDEFHDDLPHEIIQEIEPLEDGYLLKTDSGYSGI